MDSHIYMADIGLGKLVSCREESRTLEIIRQTKNRAQKAVSKSSFIDTTGQVTCGRNYRNFSFR
jgi:hypothetical protein